MSMHPMIAPVGRTCRLAASRSGAPWDARWAVLAVGTSRETDVPVHRGGGVEDAVPIEGHRITARDREPPSFDGDGIGEEVRRSAAVDDRLMV